MADLVNSPETTPSPFEFREAPKVDLCSNMSCANGHIWTTQVQLAGCPGCQSPILAIKMVNCPQCNEPSASMVLRADHLSRGAAITPICRGSASLAEVHKIPLTFGHAARTEANYTVRALPGKL